MKLSFNQNNTRIKNKFTNLVNYEYEWNKMYWHGKGQGGYSKHTQRQYIYSNLILVDVTKTKQKLWSIHERG